jgi:hypothetical protein
MEAPDLHLFRALYNPSRRRPLGITAQAARFRKTALRRHYRPSRAEHLQAFGAAGFRRRVLAVALRAPDTSQQLLSLHGPTFSLKRSFKL